MRTLTGVEHTNMLTIRDDFKDILDAATQERRYRDEPVDPERSLEPGWVVHERSVMAEAVNSRRQAAGLPPVPMEAVVRADSRAAGHVDWFDKFTLYCAWLAVGLEP